MQVVSVPSALPGSCLFCPGSVRSRYIDTGVQWDFHGAVYICDECVLSMGRMIGMISQDQAEVLIQGNADAATENYELHRKLSALEVGLNGLVDAGYLPAHALGRRSSDSDSEDVGTGDQPPSSEGTGPAQEGLPGGEALLGSRAGTPAEQGDDEGLGELRTDDGSTGRFTI